MAITATESTYGAPHRERFDAALRAPRALPEGVIEVIRRVSAAHPMDVLRTAVSALAAFDPDTGGMSEGGNLREGSRPTGPPPAAPRPPGPAPPPLVVAASGPLKGPRHGGAAEAVMKLVQEIGEPERAEAVIAGKRERGEKIMGFGHRVYRVGDPRARHMRERARELGEKMGQPKWFRIHTAIQDAMAPLADRGGNVNTGFYAGAVHPLLGVPVDVFVPMFAIGRMPGWIAQVMEQWQDNTLIRPLLEYEGPENLEYVPLERRL